MCVILPEQETQAYLNICYNLIDVNCLRFYYPNDIKAYSKVRFQCNLIGYDVHQVLLFVRLARSKRYSKVYIYERNASIPLRIGVSCVI